jgi:hypothetical protein
MRGALRFPSIVVCEEDGLREGLNPSYELFRPFERAGRPNARSLPSGYAQVGAVWVDNALLGAFPRKPSKNAACRLRQWHSHLALLATFAFNGPSRGLDCNG